MRKIKQFILRHWPLRFLAFLLLRPRWFLDEFVYSLSDYRKFRATTESYRAFLSQGPRRTPDAGAPGLLAVAGHAMNVQWCQLWAVLAVAYPRRGYVPYILTSRNQPVLNLYFKLFGLTLLFMEDIDTRAVAVPADVAAQFDALDSFPKVKAFELNGAPLGKMALSTYSRQRMTGITDIDTPEARKEVRFWLGELYRMGVAAHDLFRRYNIEIVFSAEIFMEEYGAIYYAALRDQLNIVRWAGTVRDNAVVVQHMNALSDRTHFSSFSKPSWARITACTDLTEVERQIEANFMDRYGGRWAMSTRNQPNTKIVSGEQARAELGIPAGRKVAVVYSHILYDTLFFNGEDVFANYAQWLVETVKAACANPKITWFIKVHPSNLWRGELSKLQGGTYEEVRLIQQHVGELPDHVRMIYPDTPYSPYTWLQVADYGITVRGTSGIELGALGKTVITAGTGRYEAAGFTLNPQTVPEYMTLLGALPDAKPPTDDQIRIGKLFAFATFCMKPFTLDFFKPVPRTGRTRIFSTDDLVYLGNFPQPPAMPKTIASFVAWSLEKDTIDFLSHWDAIRQAPALESAE